MNDVEEQQTWLNRRKSLAEAQIELVLALCYMVPEEESVLTASARLEWTILEAHEPVAVMVQSWLESAFSTRNCEHCIPKKSHGGTSESMPSAKPSAKQVMANDAASSSVIDSNATQLIGHTDESKDRESLEQHGDSSHGD